MFNPSAVFPNLSKAVLNKVERWALTLSAFRYTVSHIPGDANCWADLLSRWAVPEDPATFSLPALIVAPVAPHLDPDFYWPTASGILNSQEQWASAEPHPRPTRDGLRVFENGAIWIPVNDTQLQ